MQKLEIIEVTKAHWREFHPASYRELVETGALDREAEAAADLTLREMDVLQQTHKISSREAWQESRALFCLKDPLKQ